MVATTKRLSPGLIALILVAILAFSLSFTIDRGRGALDEAYGSVAVVVCGQGYGTGWWINDDIMITAAHVVQGCSNVTVVRGEWSASGRVIATDPVLDVAAIRVSRPGWAESLELSPRLAIGDRVWVVGYPIQLYEETGRDVERMSEIPRAQQATVTWINPDKQIFEFSPGTDAGNSGGPIVSVESGGVVGIVVYARHGVVSEGYYGLRMDGLVQFLDQHGIEYRVAGSHSMLLYAGLGIIAVLAIILVKDREKHMFSAAAIAEIKVRLLRNIHSDSKLFIIGIGIGILLVLLLLRGGRRGHK